MATVESIPLLLERAEQLRKIRAACRQFMALGLESTTRGGADSAGCPVPCDASGEPFTSSEEADLADPYNSDWSLLYRGSVLDD